MCVCVCMCKYRNIYKYAHILLSCPSLAYKDLKVSKLANCVRNLQDERSSWSWLEKTFIADWLIPANLGKRLKFARHHLSQKPHHQRSYE